MHRRELALRTALTLVLAGLMVRPSHGEDGGVPQTAGEQARPCDEKKAALRPELDKVLAEHDSCKKSSECTLLTPGCPFGCYVGVRKSEVAVVTARAKELATGLGEDCRCFYKCLAPPSVSCVHGRCSVKWKRP